MFKRGKELAQCAVESLTAPTVADATKAAEQRRAELVAAQAALEKAVEVLNAAEDSGAELAPHEATIASARITAERAQRAHASAERRFNKAQAAERERGMAQGREQRDALLAERAVAGGEIAANLAGLKESLARLDSADARLSALQSAGHVRNASFGPQQSHARIGVAVDDILSGTRAPRTEPFNVWIEYQNDTAKSADSKPAAPVESVAQRST